MSMSGIAVSPETLEVFGEMKRSGAKAKTKANEEPTTTKRQLLVMEIHNEKEVKVNDELCADVCNNDGLREFVKSHHDTAYFIIHDFLFRGNKKLVGIAWIPECCKVKQKMIYSSTYEGIKGKFEGVKWCGTVTDPADCEDNDIIANF